MSAESDSDKTRETTLSAPALATTQNVTMVLELDTGEFVRLSRTQRIAKCREMAAEASRLAVGKRSDVSASYLELATQWSTLADEMESVSEA